MEMRGILFQIATNISFQLTIPIYYSLTKAESLFFCCLSTYFIFIFSFWSFYFSFVCVWPPDDRPGGVIGSGRSGPRALSDCRRLACIGSSLAVLDGWTFLGEIKIKEIK